MNAPREYYNKFRESSLQRTEQFFGAMLHGKVESIASCETLQVNDYSQYSMGMFDEAQRKEIREKVFPKDLEDLEAAFNLGAELSK